MIRRRRALTGLLAGVAVVAALLAAPVSSEAHGSSTPNAITGQDGLLYDPAPTAVVGKDGNLFYGPDFDQACHYGAKLERGIKHLADLARVIQQSGRQVRFTVAPSKTAVTTGELLGLPHGVCDQVGLQQEDQVLDSYRAPGFLPLRKPLRADKLETYWRTDLHWDTVGGLVYTKELPDSLDPRLARQQRYKIGTYTANGILSRYIGDDTSEETVPDAVPDNGVVSQADPGSPAFTALPDIVFDYSWTSTPAKKTWPGQTLLIGDSFTLYALRTLKPLFSNGRFLWIAHVAPDTITQAIKSAHTVVIEIAQVLLMRSTVTEKSFRDDLRRALK